MNQNEPMLLNFMIDPAIKNQFHRICRSTQSNMTAELNRMIRQFVAENKQSNIFERPLRWISAEQVSRP